MIAIKRSSGKTTDASTGATSKNGSAWGGSYVSRSTTAITPAGAMRVGYGYIGAMESGGIASIMIYEKLLSDAEIKQNYDALKGRFGL